MSGSISSSVEVCLGGQCKALTSRIRLGNEGGETVEVIANEAECSA